MKERACIILTGSFMSGWDGYKSILAKQYLPCTLIVFSFNFTCAITPKHSSKSPSWFTFPRNRPDGIFALESSTDPIETMKHDWIKYWQYDSENFQTKNQRKNTSEINYFIFENIIRWLLGRNHVAFYSNWNISFQTRRSVRCHLRIIRAWRQRNVINTQRDRIDKIC